MATRQISLPAALTSFDEGVDDRVGALVSAAQGIGATYDDAGNLLTLNAGSMIVPYSHITASLTNQAAGDTEYPTSQQRHPRVDLSAMSEVRVGITVTAAGAAGSDIRPQYSTDNAAWNEISASDASVSMAALGDVAGSWVSLVAGAKADVYLRLVAKDGDGAADPSLAYAAFQFR